MQHGQKTNEKTTRFASLSAVFWGGIVFLAFPRKSRGSQGGSYLVIWGGGLVHPRTPHSGQPKWVGADPPGLGKPSPERWVAPGRASADPAGAGPPAGVRCAGGRAEGRRRRDCAAEREGRPFAYGTASIQEDLPTPISQETVTLGKRSPKPRHHRDLPPASVLADVSRNQCFSKKILLLIKMVFFCS